MTIEYIDSRMKTRAMIVMILFIVAVCAISLIPFSNNSLLEGNESITSAARTTTPGSTTAVGTTTPGSTTAVGTTTPRSTTAVGTTTPGSTTAVGTTTTPRATTSGTKPITNKEFLDLVIQALGSTPDKSSDKVKIYNIQGFISSLRTQNSATLLGEIGNPNNLNDPRLFLQYMNWFGSNCPVDSDTCTDLSY